MTISVKFVKRIILCLDNSTQHVQLSTRFSSDCIQDAVIRAFAYIVQTLLYLCKNQATGPRGFASGWKTATVFPIPKKGRDSVTQQSYGYRSISILPIAHKIFEVLIKNI